MNVEQIKNYRMNRDSRLPHRPFVVFFDTFQQCEEAASAILNNRKLPFNLHLERSSVITAVTAIEVYYKDVLDGIFRLCLPEFFAPKLKHIHDKKYDISEIWELEHNNISALELVTSSKSFQNIEVIEKVFSKFIDAGFWKTVLELQVIRKDKPDDIVSWNQADLDGLKSTFQLRHELVHNPARHSFMSDEVHTNLGKAAHMVWGSDVVLMNMIANNSIQSDASVAGASD